MHGNQGRSNVIFFMNRIIIIFLFVNFIFTADIYCQKDSIIDTEILALVKFEESKEILDIIYLAWRADRKLGKFHSIETNKIGCINYFIRED